MRHHRKRQLRRRRVLFLAIPMIVFLAVLTGWNRTAADDQSDQSVDFQLSQIMVKLNQIEWELSQVRNRLGAQDQRLTDIDRQLDRILEEIEDAASTVSADSASSSAATDPALAGTWRLSSNDFADVIPNNIRNYLEDRAEELRRTNVSDLRDRVGAGREADRIERNIEENVDELLDGFEVSLDQAGFHLFRFRPDGMYTDGTGDEGMWLVSDSRLILTTFDGRAYPCTYSVDGADLTLTITGDQIGTLLRLEARTRRAIALARDPNIFKYTDQVRLFYTKDQRYR